MGPPIGSTFRLLDVLTVSGVVTSGSPVRGANLEAGRTCRGCTGAPAAAGEWVEVGRSDGRITRFTFGKKNMVKKAMVGWGFNPWWGPLSLQVWSPSLRVVRPCIRSQVMTCGRIRLWFSMGFCNSLISCGLRHVSLIQYWKTMDEDGLTR